MGFSLQVVGAGRLNGNYHGGTSIDAARIEGAKYSARLRENHPHAVVIIVETTGNRVETIEVVS